MKYQNNYEIEEVSRMRKDISPAGISSSSAGLADRVLPANRYYRQLLCELELPRPEHARSLTTPDDRYAKLPTPVLSKYLKAPNIAVAAHAAEILGLRQATECIDSILERLTVRATGARHAKLVASLGRMGSAADRAVPRLLELGKIGAGCTFEIAFALKDIGTEGAIKALANLACYGFKSTQEPIDIACWALKAVAEIGKPAQMHADTLRKEMQLRKSSGQNVALYVETLQAIG